MRFEALSALGRAPRHQSHRGGSGISNSEADLPETETVDQAPDAEPPSAWDKPVSPSDHFRPDIEGLRAVAVGAVLLYHAGLPLTSGGFIGVDVFYVISGFLITGLLLREYERSGGINLIQFYARRARRLLPAALVVIVATVGLSAVALSVIELRSVAADAAAAALYVSNFRFALQATDYLAANEPSPLLHYWSLGVEEQFYLFWPLIVLAAARLVGVARLWLVIVAIAAGSFALSVWLTAAAQPWAFFSLPTRAWELALGALAAVGLFTLPGRWPSWFASAVGLVGLLAISLATVLITPNVPFPGVVAVVPALGALLIVVAGERSDSFGARLLAIRPARWIGRISYSLYLWHWPILVLIPPLIGRNDLGTRLVLAVACLLIADLSTRFVETPFRSRRLTRIAASRSVVAAVGISALIALGSVATGELAVQHLRSGSASIPTPTPSPSPTSAPASATPSGDPTPATPSMQPSPPSSANPGASQTPGSSVEPPPTTPQATPLATPSAFPVSPLPPPILAGPVPADLRPSLLDADADVSSLLRDGCQSSVGEAVPEPCTYGNSAGPTTVALIGDSHAAHWLPTLEALAAQRGWRIQAMTKASCPPIALLVWLENYSRPYTDCLEWAEAALVQIERMQPAITFVSFSRHYLVVDGEQLLPATQVPGRWTSATEALLTRIDVASGTTVYIADTPRHERNPVHCLASRLVVSDCPSLRADTVDAGYAAIEAAAAAAAGVDLLVSADWLCDATACPLIFGSYLVYRDQTHISATFAAVLAPVLGAWLDRPRATWTPSAT